MAVKKNNTGKFSRSLLRNGKEVLSSRAKGIIDVTEMTYRQTVERLEVEGRKLDMEQEEMLDMAPDDVNSLQPAKNFDADDFVKRDIELAKKKQVHALRLKAAKARYKELFGA